MGNILFGVDIASIVDGAISPGLLPATLHSITPGTRTPGDPTAGTNPTTTDHAGRGIIDDYDEKEIDGDVIRVGDRKILLIGNSIAGLTVPKPNDEVTIEGRRYTAVRVKRDPAAATYTIQARGVSG